MGIGKKKIIIPILVVVMLAILGGIAFYILRVNKPKFVFDYTINQILSMNKQKDFNTILLDTSIDVELESSDEKEDDETTEFINNSTILMKTQLDKNQKEEIISLALESDDEKIIDATAKLEEQSEKAYINLGDLFSKVIEIDTDMENINEFVNENVDGYFDETAQKILANEIKTQFGKKYFSKENVLLNDEKVTKNTFRIQEIELSSVISNICNNLSKNEEFLACFENREELKENLQTVIDEITEKSTSESDNITYVIDIYTKGFRKQLKEIDMTVKNDAIETSALKLTKTNNKEFTYEVFSEEEKTYSGTIRYNDNSINLSVVYDMESFGKITLSLVASVEYDGDLNDFNTSNSVKYSELSEKDYSEISSNLSKNKLYKLVIQPLLGFDVLEGVSTTDSDNTNNSSSTQKVSVDGKEISFEVPDNYQNGNVQNLENDTDSVELVKKSELDEARVIIKAQSQTQNDYFSDLQTRVNEYLNDDKYENIEVEKQDTLAINGKEFLRVVLTYKEDGIFTRETNIIYVINDESIYTVEIKDNADLVKNDELEKFLQITVKEKEENNALTIQNSNDETEDVMSVLEEQEKSGFNARFESYKGKQKGAQIKSLISIVEKSNEENEDRKISVKFAGSLYTDGISEIEDLIDSSGAYQVEFQYNSDNIVNKIIITEV